MRGHVDKSLVRSAPTGKEPLEEPEPGLSMAVALLANPANPSLARPHAAPQFSLEFSDFAAAVSVLYRPCQKVLTNR